MQNTQNTEEVEVSPRGVYIRDINVLKGKTILWWFSTKKKNISFGLYQRRGSAVSAKVAAPTTDSNTEIQTPIQNNLFPTTLKTIKSRASLHSVAGGVNRTSMDTNDTDDNDDTMEENI